MLTTGDNSSRQKTVFVKNLINMVNTEKNRIVNNAERESPNIHFMDFFRDKHKDKFKVKTFNNRNKYSDGN